MPDLGRCGHKHSYAFDGRHPTVRHLAIDRRDWEKAKTALEQAGNVVNVTEVLATEVEDRPGGLPAILKILEKAKVNVEYMYAFTFRNADKAIMFFRFDNPDDAVKVLEEQNINVVGPVELFSLSNN